MSNWLKVSVIMLAAIVMAAVLPMSGNAQLGKKKFKKPGGGGGESASAMKAYPACNGPKKRIAIYRFKDGVNSGESRAIKGSLLEELQHELLQTGCFLVLVTNEDLADAAAEIAGGQSGMANERHQPQAGKQLGAQALFQGILTGVSFTQSQSVGIGIPGGALGDVGGAMALKMSTAKVVIMIKMFDPETRILQFSERAEGLVKKRAIALKADYEGVVVGGKLTKETPLGDAAIRAIHDAVYIIVSKMNNIPWQATILKVTGPQVIIRGGPDSGLQPGQMLQVYKRGEMLEDPDTGEMLQLPGMKIGQVRVTQVQDKFVFAEIISGPVMAGMRVKLQ